MIGIDLLLSSKVSEVILHLMKTLQFHNVSKQRKFPQNRFINDCARKNPGTKDFVVRCSIKLRS